MTMRPDRTFHASPRLAMEAPQENFAYTLLLSPDRSSPDALAVIDVTPGSPTYSQIVHTVTMPHKGDEFHHFGWNACSSSLSPLTGHAFLERRYLIIPGIRSSRIYVVDTQAASHAGEDPQDHRTGGGVPEDGLFATRIRSIADRKASTSVRWAAAARTAPTGRLASSSWTVRRSRSSDGGRSIAAASACTMTSGGTCRATTWCRASGGCHHNSRTESCRRTCSRTSMAIGSTSGTFVPAATSRRSISAPITRWRWRFGQRTTPFASTGSSASSSIPRISKARSGRGGATAASSISRRPRRSRPSPRPRTSCRPCCRGSAPCRRS